MRPPRSRVRPGVPHRLRRRLVRLAARGARRLEGRPLHAPLQLDARQRIIALEVLGTHAHEQRRVRVRPVAREAAHAVHHDAALLAGGAHHLAAGAHAERVRLSLIHI